MAFQQRKPAKPLTVDEALLKMERFCAYRERCPKEVRDQIKALGITGPDAKQIYEVLETDQFFNESRFAMAYALGKFRVNHWGKIRIKLELQHRHIDPDLIGMAIAEIDDDQYQAVLLKLLTTKYLNLTNDEKAYEKTAAYGIRTGFEPGLVFETLKRVKNNKQ